jgi:putative intracellular protease/amidase
MKVMFTVLLIVASAACIAKERQKKVLLMVAEGFYAPEYYIPLKEFKEAGFVVTTASKYKRATRPDERHLQSYKAVVSDITFDEIVADEYDAIVFSGGNGAWEDYFPNDDVHKAIGEFMSSDKLVALLCSSVGLLGVASNLDGSSVPIAAGRNVTGYKRVKGLLVNLGKTNYFPGERGVPFVVVDGNLVTGRDPLSAKLFAKTVVKVLLTKASERRD